MPFFKKKPSLPRLIELTLVNGQAVAIMTDKIVAVVEFIPPPNEPRLARGRASIATTIPTFDPVVTESVDMILNMLTGAPSHDL